MYDIRSFYPATSVQDAIRALAADETAVLISGGTDVLVKLREGGHTNCALVSIHRLPELTGVRREADGTIVIGSCTCFTDLAENELLQAHLPALAEAAGNVGGPQVRCEATIGGNVCNGAVSADSAPSLLALNAVLKFSGSAGTREVPVREFHTGPGKTVRKHDEILTAIYIAPENYENYGAKYIKFGKRAAMEIATLGCAASVKLNGAKDVVEELRLAFGVAAPTPIRCPRAEETAVGKPLTEETLAAIGEEAMKEAQPRGSWRASKVFRLQLVRELAARTTATAIENAGGAIRA
jgi:xanthine dehydrogenase FAD-binding subunit